MTEDIGVAVIGAGMAGRAHAHGYRSAGTVFSAGLPPIRLASVADINEELAADTARRYGFARSDSSWQAIVKAADIDVVSVVVANHLHREIVEELAAAGKHVLCEKPLAPTSTDAQAMVDAVDAAGVVARVGFTFRRTPGIAAAREQIASGELGRPLYVNAQYWTDYGSDPQAPMSWRYRGGPGSGALADLGSFVGVEHPYIAGGLAMDATGIGTGHNDSFVYQARAFLDEVAGRDELPRNASFADGLHALLLEEAVVRTATQNTPTPVTA
jgi:predicted dehydrogenase